MARQSFMPSHKPRPSPRPGRALSETEIDELQSLLDQVPAPLDALDVGLLDGYLCGVLVQPDGVPTELWLPHVTDVDGRALPESFDTRRLFELIERRHAELDDAIGRRQWFDPWVFELEAGSVAVTEADDPDDLDDLDDAPPEVDAVYPWVAGFATALELFPGLMRRDETLINPPLALLYRHLAPDDLEDADELLALIDELEPPVDLDEAVEGLVRATLLLADVGRPIAASASPRGRHRPPRRR